MRAFVSVFSSLIIFWSLAGTEAHAQTCEGFFTPAPATKPIVPPSEIQRLGGNRVRILIGGVAIEGTVEPMVPSVRRFYQSEKERDEDRSDETTATQIDLVVRPTGRQGRIYVFSENDDPGRDIHGGAIFRSAIWTRALKEPETLARYGVFASRTHLVIPDATLANPLFIRELFKRARDEGEPVPNLRFESLSIMGNQSHLMRQFFEAARDGKILMASHGPWFFHDWVQEHFVAAIFMPVRYLNAFSNLVQFYAAAEKLSLLQKAPDLVHVIESKGSLAIATLWETMTTDFMDDYGRPGLKNPHERVEAVLLSHFDRLRKVRPLELESLSELERRALDRQWNALFERHLARSNRQLKGN